MISPQIQLSDGSRAGDRRTSPRPMRVGVVSLNRNSLTRFLPAENVLPNEWSAELANVTHCSSDRSLAKGILKQTAHDLRRFRSARTRGQRDLYADAYTWLVANDFAWPCSFLNVCATLGLQPEQTRADLIEAATEPWYSHLLTVARNTANSFVSIL